MFCGKLPVEISPIYVQVNFFLFYFSINSLFRLDQYDTIRVCSGDISSYLMPRQRVLRVISELMKFAK